MKKYLAKMKWACFGVSVLLLSACDHPAETRPTPDGPTREASALVRETQSGSVQGNVQGNVLVWLGVPYGGDTSGDARWKAPTDPAPWGDVLDATAPGAVALQSGTDGVTGSENALNVDIYRPNNNENKLPVMVYVHGGNNQTGQSGEISGASFVERHNAIVVSVNYRLGPLGFNPLPALKTGNNAAEDSGNYALLDLNQSLDWVRANIENFGGDAGNITVAGFSAGGRDVMAMLISPLFAGKFDKAISFSGGMTIADEAKSQQVFAKALAPLVVEDGLKANEEEAAAWLLTSGRDVRDYLYSLAGERLVPLMGNASIRMSVFPHLYNDGTVIPKEGFDTTHYNAVPLLMLSGEQEFSLFSRFDRYFAGGDFSSDESMAAQYAFVNKYGGQLYSLFNVQDSAEKMAPSYSSPIYAMEILFGEDAAVVGEKMAVFGAFHGVFVPLLDTDSQNYTGLVGDAYSLAGAKKLSALFQDYIYAFMLNGDPNGEGRTAWTAWQPGAEESILFLDADKTTASATMGKKAFTYDSVLDSIDADDSVTSEQKAALLKNVMNGRWFSKGLDEKYGNLSEFSQ